VTERRALVQPDNRDLSIRRQCELLSLNRSTHYYVPAD
jgi:putative transposase